jgi:hypothetical protein
MNARFDQDAESSAAGNHAQRRRVKSGPLGERKAQALPWLYGANANRLAGAEDRMMRLKPYWQDFCRSIEEAFTRHPACS